MFFFCLCSSSRWANRFAACTIDGGFAAGNYGELLADIAAAAAALAAGHLAYVAAGPGRQRLRSCGLGQYAAAASPASSLCGLRMAWLQPFWLQRK
jgi:hypothetical protein